MMNLSNLLAVVPCDTDKSAFRQAIEDAAVIFLFTLISSLLALGLDGLHWSALYIPFLSAALIGVVTYAQARNINLPKKE
jgi:hypothetical protein